MHHVKAVLFTALISFLTFSAANRVASLRKISGVDATPSK